MKRTSKTVVSLSSLSLLLIWASPATAAWESDTIPDGITVGVTQEVLARANNNQDLATGAPDKRIFEYASSTTCQNSAPGSPGADIPCMAAIQACAGNTPQEGLGPQILVSRRQLDANGKPLTRWIGLWTTCLADQVPGKQVLGVPQILAAFNKTAFAVPTVHMQPEGNVTLVTLATYFEVRWPTDGFQPGEIDTVTLMGYQVRIRPMRQSYTYIFGDGTSAGPTPSPGGTYPNGDITHTYAKAGIYTSHIDITYGGEYSVEGGGWLPIPGTVPIAGQPQIVTVKTAKARLVTR